MSIVGAPLASKPTDPTKMKYSISSAVRRGILVLTAMLGSLTSAQAQTLLWEVYGQAAEDGLGRSVAGIDDLDGDGVPDVIVGATQRNNANSNDGPGYVLVLSGASGALIFSFAGQNSGDDFGVSVANAGDVDNDGTADIVVGASGLGCYVQVFSGATGGLLRTWVGGATNLSFGRRVAGVGDLDLDGHGDILVGDIRATPVGSLSGSATVFSGGTGAVLFEFEGTQQARLGAGVAGLGDVNGDAVPDFAIGAPYNGPNGWVTVYSGLDGSVLHAATEGTPRSGFGWSVEAVGDVNQDGSPDLLVGEPGGENFAGVAWVFSGLDGSVLHRFTGLAPGDLLADDQSMSGAGDVDGDGIPDILLGTHNADVGGSVGAGGALVFSGASGAPLFEFEGFEAGGAFGLGTAGLGDLDGDGLSDLGIAGPWHTGQGGEVHAGLLQVFASPQPGPPADPDLSLIIADPVDVAFLGESTITVTPKDSFGVDMGAGHRVYLATTVGVMLGSVVDHGNGTYSQTLQADVNLDPSVVSAAINGPAIANTVVVTTSGPQITAVADMDLPVAGTVDGSFADTQLGDNVSQSIRELTTNGKPANRTSHLEHKWTMDVPAGSQALFFVQASTGLSADQDDYDFAYSLDDLEYTPMLTVPGGNSDAYHTFTLPSGTSGVVYIRVVDTDRAGGNEVRDVIRVDHMGIAVFSGSVEPPMDPSALLATALSSSRIDLDWSDNSNNEDGFSIERSLDGIVWSHLDLATANATSYSDVGLAAETAYFYRVAAFNLAGSSGTSNIASATTLASGGSVDDVATGEVSGKGTVTGSFLETQADDGLLETLRERESGGKPANRTSLLEHKWTIDVTGGSSVTFFIKAFHDVSPDGDNFLFAYSTDDNAYEDMLTVTQVADSGTYQTSVLPASTTGTLYIRVRDTNRTEGARNLDALHVDHMFVRSQD